MGRLGTVGTSLIYNHVSFDETTETTAFSVKPTMDASGRTVAYNQFDIRFRTVVSGTNVGSKMEQFRKALSHNGREFRMTGRPCGDIEVNVGSIRDIANGPIVTEINHQFHGTRSAILDWAISFSIPECDDAHFEGVQEFTYTVTHEVDDLGYTKRSINGKIKVAQNTNEPGGKFSRANADDYWEDLQPDFIQGFRRTYGPRTLSADRSTLEFTIVDTELKGPAPPPGVANHNGNVSYTSENGLGQGVWSGVLKYKAVVAKGGSIDDAIKGFQQFLVWRFNQMRLFADAKNGTVTLYPSKWTIDEGDIADPNSVSVTVQFLVGSTFESLIKRSGLWTIANGHGNWKRWAQSLSGTAMHPRGWAKLEFNEADDEIINLCSRGNPKVASPKGKTERILRNNDVIDLFPPVFPDRSWLQWENSLHLEQDSGVVGTRLLPTQPLTDRTDRDGQVDIREMRGGQFPIGGDFGGGAFGGGVGNNFTPPGGGGRLEPEYLPDGKNMATRTARPQVFVIMIGRAARIKFEIPQPALTEVNGVPVIPANRPDMNEGFFQKIIWNNGDSPVYRAEWRLRYLVDGDLPDSPLPIPPNPTLNPGR